MEDKKTAPEDNGEIIFDTQSGISEEEQREILAGLDAIAGKNRLAPPAEEMKILPRKRGGLFPVLVNTAGVVLLLGGFISLSAFHGRSDLMLREGPSSIDASDRQLVHEMIREIRKENAASIGAKEQEIASMTAMLEGVDAELQNMQIVMDKSLADKESDLRKEMQSAVEEERRRLTAQNLSEAAIAEQMRIFDRQQIGRLDTELAAYRKQLDADKAASEAGLQKLQEEYRSNLSGLQAERAQILEAARIREANIHAQAEERIAGISSLYEQSRNDVSAAREELQRLSGEQERSALIERQLGGYYASINRQIQEGRFREAEATLAVMREFLDTPAFQNIRAVQTRKDLHLSVMSALSEMIHAALIQGTAGSAGTDNSGALDTLTKKIAELETKTSTLEGTIKDKNLALEAYESGGSEQILKIKELSDQISALRDTNTALETEKSALTQNVTRLTSENENLSRTAATQETTIRSLTTQNTALTGTIENFQRAAEAYQQTLNPSPGN